MKPNERASSVEAIEVEDFRTFSIKERTSNKNRTFCGFIKDQDQDTEERKILKIWATRRYRREQNPVPMLRIVLQIMARYDTEAVPVIVIDPFAGTHTTGVAARAMGCPYIGFDKKPESKWTGIVHMTNMLRLQPAGSYLVDLNKGTGDEFTLSQAARGNNQAREASSTSFQMGSISEFAGIKEEAQASSSSSDDFAMDQYFSEGKRNKNQSETKKEPELDDDEEDDDSDEEEEEGKHDTPGGDEDDEPPLTQRPSRKKASKRPLHPEDEEEEPFIAPAPKAQRKAVMSSPRVRPHGAESESCSSAEALQSPIHKK